MCVQCASCGQLCALCVCACVPEQIQFAGDVTAAAAAFMLGVVVTVDNVIVEKEGESMLVSIDCGA